MKRKKHNQPVPKANFFVNFIRGIWNTLGNAKRWVVQNPGKMFIGALLVSTGAVIGKLINQNNASNTAVAVNSEGQLLQATSQPICPVILFYEVHSDKAPAEMMTALFPNLVEGGYKTFLFEEPTGTSLAQNIRIWDSQLVQITSNLNAGLYEGLTLNVTTLLESLKTSLKLLKRI